MRDPAPHRQAIIEVLRQTDLKVLICPEDQTQKDVGIGRVGTTLGPQPVAVWHRAAQIVAGSP